jgi:GNAT superfamily N-acetyltransferase
VDVADRLDAHLRHWLGAWPPEAAVHVVGSELRERPGWDGAVRPLVGVVAPLGAVVSVPPAWVDLLDPLAGDLERLTAALPAAIGRPDDVVTVGVFRWTADPSPLPDAGEWVPTADPRVPDWLRPFNGDVLVAWDEAGVYAGGVGRKMHDRWGHELAVGTEPALRGKGIARRLVAQAARRVIADGAVPTYLHDPANVASAHVADASGLPDRGWRVLSLHGHGLPEDR